MAYRDVAEEGGLVVLTDRAQVKVLNPVGSRVFALLDGEHTVAAIIDVVTREFEVEGSEAGRDVREFLEELAEAGMLAGTEGAPEGAST